MKKSHDDEHAAAGNPHTHFGAEDCCPDKRAEAGTAANGGTELTAVDPVCGMTVNVNAGKPHLSYKGTDYHFCSQKCRELFGADTYFYLSGNKAKKKVTAPADARYTCPMDPEIVQEGPGTCPICGMALEPMDGKSEGPNEELVDFSRRLWVSAGGAVPLLFLTMGPMIGLPVRDWIGETISQYIELLIATPVVLWAARPFFHRGWTSLKTGNFNMWTLIMLGVGAAYLYSLAATLVPGIFPANMQTGSGHVPVYFEASVVIIALVFVGQVLELRARERTGDAIRALLDLTPKTARRVLADGEEYDAPLENIVEGDRLRVRPGESVPVDAHVLEGRSAVDESMISGEPVPVEKATGDTVTGGTINKNGTLVIKATRVGDETMLARIVAMVSAAQRSRAPIQGLADRVARYFVPAVVTVAIAAFGAWLLFGPAPALAFATVSAVSVLIIACPCALGLATPMSIMTATGRGAQSGILIRDAEALEQMARIDTLIVDKTGTLTEGQPKLTDVVTCGNIGETELLRLVASLERASEHPLAEAIVSGAAEREIVLGDADAFEATTGKGAAATISGRSVAVGNVAMMKTAGADLSSAHVEAGRLGAEGKTVIYVAVDGNFAGLIAIADPIKENAAEVVASLQRAAGDHYHGDWRQ